MGLQKAGRGGRCVREEHLQARLTNAPFTEAFRLACLTYFPKNQAHAVFISFLKLQKHIVRPGARLAAKLPSSDRARMPALATCFERW